MRQMMNRMAMEQGRPPMTADQVRTNEREFIRSVYAWMFGGLLITAMAAAWAVLLRESASSPPMNLWSPR